jgi:hypothetical protein
MPIFDVATIDVDAELAATRLADFDHERTIGLLYADAPLARRSSAALLALRALMK